jgi:hypothetical protein
MDEPFAPPIILPDHRALAELLPNFRADQLKMSGAVLHLICQQYGLNDGMIIRAITPQDGRLAILDDMIVERQEFDAEKQVIIARVKPPSDEILAILREEAHQAREELSRKLRTLPIKKVPSGTIGPKAVISYLAAMMVQAVAETKEPMPPALAALLRDQLCGQYPKLLTVVCADLDEQDAIDRAAMVFRADETISIGKVAERLGLSPKIVRELFSRGFKEKLRKHRETMARAQTYAQEFMKR